jgi:hypothetical protein
LSASFVSWDWMALIADAAAPSRVSSNKTSCPASAAICAMPLPIAPAPMTATVLLLGSGVALMV